MNSDTKQREAAMNAARTDAYTTFLARPVTRMMMSMIPAGEQRETLDTLLQETFDAGFTAGGGEMLVSFLTGIVQRDQRKV